MNLFVLLAEAAAPTSGNPLEAVTKTFNLNWQMFISQLLAFLVIAVAFKMLAYPRVLEMLEARKQRIAESLANADKIKADLAAAQQQAQELVNKAAEQASKIIEEARAAANQVRSVETQKAIADAQQIVEKARQATEAEHARMMAELRREVGRLVVETTAKVSGKVLTMDDQKRLAEETSKELAA
jgi:F-type H+-transporting ATPase subunit b